MSQLPYVLDLYSRQRRRTRVVMVGDVAVGGDNPIRVQSMTTTLTKDIGATVAQAERLVHAGCEIVRITTPTPSDARCLGPIKEKLAERGITVPLVADIHFSPAAALAAAEFADKVRVNPGNYADSRSFKVREYTDEEYNAELARVAGRFTPLVLRCKERGIAMRIGTNHGSLSDRIMNRFGDTPEGMVESALEFVRICRTHDFHDIILSMKASNPKVMIAAYRLLAARMDELGWDYPFHLGVTEAGNGEDGRVKSAIGIGSLLADGIGDTIRVSLTEEPEEEIPVAYALAGRFAELETATGCPISQAPWDFYHYERRRAREIAIGDVPMGAAETVPIIVPIEGPLATQPKATARVLRWASPAGRRQPKPEAALVELRGAADLEAVKRIADRLARWPQAGLALIARGDVEALREALSALDGVLVPPHDAARLAGVIGDRAMILDGQSGAIDEMLAAASQAMRDGVAVILSIDADRGEGIHAYRRLASRAAEMGVDAPILLRGHGNGRAGTGTGRYGAEVNVERPVAAAGDGYLEPAITIGSLLCDGIGDAVMVEGMEDSTALAFTILQAAGTRLSRTDYVACPSCGRTLFDLQETTERIKEKTSHLVGVRLAIMGCIVNGPGEMADADFGYVGGAPGQVNLYVGKECVEKGVPAEEADGRLVDLIKAHGKWHEVEEDTPQPEPRVEEDPVA